MSPPHLPKHCPQRKRVCCQNQFRLLHHRHHLHSTTATHHQVAAWASGGHHQHIHKHAQHARSYIDTTQQLQQLKLKKTGVALESTTEVIALATFRGLHTHTNAYHPRLAKGRRRAAPPSAPTTSLPFTHGCSCMETNHRRSQRNISNVNTKQQCPVP